MPTRPTRLLALLAALGFLPVASAAGQEPASPPGVEPVVVPFQMLASNHMVVEVKLNGKGPFTLIFDVGSPVTLLSNRAARESGLVKGDDGGFPMLFGARGAQQVDKLEVGSLVADDVPVLVMDHPVVAALAQVLKKPLDGLMGHTFFARYKTTIDYKAQTMAFVPVDHRIEDLFSELPDRLMGPKKAKKIVLEPAALLGLRVDASAPASPDGVPVAEVLAGSPAAEAGLRAGDILASLDGRWTTSATDVYAAASRLQPGQAVELTVLRDGQPLTLTLTPRAGF